MGRKIIIILSSVAVFGFFVFLITAGGAMYVAVANRTSTITPTLPAVVTTTPTPTDIPTDAATPTTGPTAIGGATDVPTPTLVGFFGGTRAPVVPFGWCVQNTMVDRTGLGDYESLTWAKVLTAKDRFLTINWPLPETEPVTVTLTSATVNVGYWKNSKVSWWSTVFGSNGKSVQSPNCGGRAWDLGNGSYIMVYCGNPVVFLQATPTPTVTGTLTVTGSTPTPPGGGTPPPTDTPIPTTSATPVTPPTSTPVTPPTNTPVTPPTSTPVTPPTSTPVAPPTATTIPPTVPPPTVPPPTVPPPTQPRPTSPPVATAVPTQCNCPTPSTPVPTPIPQKTSTPQPVPTQPAPTAVGTKAPTPAKATPTKIASSVGTTNVAEASNEGSVEKNGDGFDLGFLVFLALSGFTVFVLKKINLW